MISAMGAGALMAGMGSLASGAGSLMAGGGQNAPFPRKLLMSQAKGAFDVYDQFGIHPLVSMGVHPSSAGLAQPSSNRDYSGFEKMGQGMRDIIAGKSELQQAQIDNIKANTEYIRSKIPGQDVSNTGILETDLPPDPVRPSNDILSKPMEQAYYMENLEGEHILESLPSQDASDYLSESYLDNMKYRLIKEGRGYSRAFSRMTQKDINVMRAYLDRVRQYHPNRAGWYWAFNFKYGRPVEIRDTKYKKKQLFDSKYIGEQRYSGFDAGINNWRNKGRQ